MNRVYGSSPRAPGGVLAVSLLPALLASVLYFAVGSQFLEHGHPHEDAYITFKYSRMLAAGEGIVFHPGGPPAEGATPFLWMLAVAAGMGLGLAAPFAALCLSSAVAGVAAGVLLAGSDREAQTGAERVIRGMLAAAVVLSPAAHASYVGFSTLAFATACVVPLHVFVRGRSSWLPAIPVLGLVAALIRPEGVAVGAGLALVGLLRARREGVLPAYVASGVAAFAAGAGYFLWRTSYFGHLLPLPLYVKSHSQATLPGLDSNLAWLQHRLPRLAALALLLILVDRPARDVILRRLAIGVLPFAVLFALLATGLHLQDVGDRFHAPLLLLLHYVLFTVGARPVRAARRARLVLFAVLMLAVAARDARSLHAYVWKGATRSEYIDAFAHGAAACLGPGDRIALTEAGRMAYWNDAEIVDLVGLNTEEFSRYAPSLRALEHFAPDLVLIHDDRTLRVDEAEMSAEDADVVELDGPLADHLRPGQPALDAVEAWAERNYSNLPLHNVRTAALTGVWFLTKQADRYRVFLVRYRGRFAHVLAIRDGFPRMDCILDVLYASPLDRPSWNRLEGWIR